MKILIISDVHGNLPALEDCLKRESDIDLLISLGDVVNFGPWGNECVDLIETYSSRISILGNHEMNFINGKSKSKSKIENAFFNQTFPNFNRHDIINSYVKRFELYDFLLTHTLEDKYIFNDTEIIINRNTVIGHSHQLFKRKVNNYYLVNPGSIGLNRRDFNLSNYILWFPEADSFELKTNIISPKKYLSEIKNLDYPLECIEYINGKL